MGRYVNELRARLELPPISGLPAEWWLSPECVIGLFPEWYGEPLRTWEIETHLTDFVMYDGSAGASLQDEAEEFLREGDQPIVFSPGTGMRHAGAFFRAAVDACRRLGRRGILVTRHVEQLPKELPRSVRHFDYLPFGALLPRVAAIVHHGGIGSVAYALSAGIPQLIMPRIYDQPDNAKRLKRLGVGDWLGPIAFRGPAVARKLSKLLDSREVAQTCREIAGRFRETHTLEQTCALIEQAGPGNDR
jgi:UDP:flavonoid glycosyltransferase YjiC (YdhE family)